MWKTPTYTDEFKAEMVRLAESGRSFLSLEREYSVNRATIKKWIVRTKQREAKVEVIQKHIKPKDPEALKSARLLFLDIETLPNQGFFFDTYSERSIPLQFITKPKAVCTIAWKFSDEQEPSVLCTTSPYEDKAILEQILPIFAEADYVVWHFGEGFDRKFLDGRLFVHRLPPIPPIASVDTCKLAKQKFGRTLNSNKLDHIGDILGVGRKKHTDASLWVRCANGDLDAMEEMAAYNAQDVLLLEQVYYRLSPNVKNKVNHNILADSPVQLCKICGSEDIELKGHELTAATWRHRYQCRICGGWSTFPRRSGKSKFNVPTVPQTRF